MVDYSVQNKKAENGEPSPMTEQEPKKYKCPCCGYFTFDAEPDGNYDICPVCYWEDDPSAYENPAETNGCNGVSLEQARKNFLLFGACTQEMAKYTRKPRAGEMEEPCGTQFY